MKMLDLYICYASVSLSFLSASQDWRKDSTREHIQNPKVWHMAGNQETFSAFFCPIILILFHLLSFFFLFPDHILERKLPFILGNFCLAIKKYLKLGNI